MISVFFVEVGTNLATSIDSVVTPVLNNAYHCHFSELKLITVTACDVIRLVTASLLSPGFQIIYTAECRVL